MNHATPKRESEQQSWALLLVFCGVLALAFGAASLLRLSRHRGTLWLRRNRRQVGLLFAWSQLLHLLGLFALGRWYPEPFLVHLSTVTLAGGGLAYFFTFAMAATSNDQAVRWLGPVRWRRFHQVGSWWIWIVFAQTITLTAWFVWVLLLGAAFLRVQSASRAWRRR